MNKKERDVNAVFPINQLQIFRCALNRESNWKHSIKTRKKLNRQPFIIKTREFVTRITRSASSWNWKTVFHSEWNFDCSKQNIARAITSKYDRHLVIQVGKGQNYKNQNIENQKEHWKNSKPSEHRKCPSIFHESDQNVENRKYQLPMAYYLWLPRPVGG
jgi:hypothetical protein